MATRKLLDVRGFRENTDNAFRKKLIEIADRNNLNPSYLAAVISFESAGTFSPTIKNPHSTAVGLIQFLDWVAKRLGTTTDELLQMTALEQLDYVEKFYRIILDWKSPDGLTTLSDHYLAVFAPAFVGRGPDAKIYKEPTNNYRANKALDRNKDGVISVAEATQPVTNIVNSARNRPLIEVTMDGDSKPDDAGDDGDEIVLGATLLFLAGIYTLSRFVYNANRHG